jgi:hypothetical protein
MMTATEGQPAMTTRTITAPDGRALATKALVDDPESEYLGAAELLTTNILGEPRRDPHATTARRAWAEVRRHLAGARNVDLSGLWRTADGRLIVQTSVAATFEQYRRAVLRRDTEAIKHMSRTSGWHLLDAAGEYIEFVADTQATHHSTT